jgi:hypothetical protein
MTSPLLEPIIEPPVPPRRLSSDLKDLLREAAGRSLTLGELEQILHGRGFALFILLLASRSLSRSQSRGFPSLSGW